jgi:hypothetical protein
MPKAETQPAIHRPYPPVELREPGIQFAPAPELIFWIEATFIDTDGILANPDHQHLQSANLGAIWTNVPNTRQMRQVLATAEIPNVRGNVWQKERQLHQLRQWFGDVPDFVITFYAPYAATADEASFCALIEHELYHCAQAENEFGGPRFRRDGTPVFTIKGHDAEEFVGVVRRYGVGAAADGVALIVEAAKSPPTVKKSEIGRACGTCQLRLA